MKYQLLKDCVVNNKIALLRCDLNVPIENGIIKDENRIKAILPTVKYLRENKAKTVILSHLGRPDGTRVEELSLKPIAKRLSMLLGCQVDFCNESIGEEAENKVKNLKYGEVIVMENLRFYKQETKNDDIFARQIANLGNIFINDAFACCHRSHSSIVGVTKYLKSVAGFLLEHELNSLDNIIGNSKRPVMAIIGGAKISTKLKLIKNLIKKMDGIVIAGAMANTFLYAEGFEVGQSLCEKDMKQEALNIMNMSEKEKCKIYLPEYLTVTKKLVKKHANKEVRYNKIKEDDIIADIGAEFAMEIANELKKYKTVIWNGPLGAFEIEPFNAGTNIVARKIAEMTKNKEIISVAGGGDIVSALNKINIANNFTYVSTGGGAFLEWMEGIELPGVKALKI